MIKLTAYYHMVSLKCSCILTLCRCFTLHPTGQTPSSGRHPPGRHPPGRHPPRQTPPHLSWDTAGYGQQAGGTHPTGMRTCFIKFNLSFEKFKSVWLVRVITGNSLVNPNPHLIGRRHFVRFELFKNDFFYFLQNTLCCSGNNY